MQDNPRRRSSPLAQVTSREITTMRWIAKVCEKTDFHQTVK